MNGSSTAASRSAPSRRPPDPASVLVRTPGSSDAVGPLHTISREHHRGGRTLALLSRAARSEFVDGWRAVDPVRTVGFDPGAAGSGTGPRTGGDHDHGTYRDLTGLSLVVSGESDWLAAGDAPGTVYVDALSPLVATAGVKPTFRFLALLSARARSADHRLVVRATPDSLEEEALASLGELFDGTFVVGGIPA